MDVKNTKILADAMKRKQTGSHRLIPRESRLGFSSFDIHGPNGETGGFLLGEHDPVTGKFEIHTVNAPGGSNSMGTAQARDLLRQLKRYHPDITSLSGLRSSGAKVRDGGAGKDITVSVPKNERLQVKSKRPRR